MQSVLQKVGSPRNYYNSFHNCSANGDVLNVLTLLWSDLMVFAAAI